MLRAQTSSMAGSFPHSLFTKTPLAGIQQISQIITNCVASSTLTLSGFTLLLKSCEADKSCLFCLVQLSVSPQQFLWVCVRLCVCSIQLTSNYSGSKSDHFPRFWVIAQPQWHGTKRARLRFIPQNITAGLVNSITYALFAREPGRILGCLFCNLHLGKGFWGSALWNDSFILGVCVWTNIYPQRKQMKQWPQIRAGLTCRQNRNTAGVTVTQH